MAIFDNPWLDLRKKALQLKQLMPP